jgi:hypothetical protein
VVVEEKEEEEEEEECRSGEGEQLAKRGQNFVGEGEDVGVGKQTALGYGLAAWQNRFLPNIFFGFAL